MKQEYERLHKNFPFLAYGVYNEEDIIGIIQNSNQYFINIYVYNLIPEENLRKLFLDLGEQYWWGSNRMLPINIIFKAEFKPFKPYLKGFAKKEFDLVFGPVINLQDQYIKKIKRKSIELVKKS